MAITRNDYETKDIPVVTLLVKVEGNTVYHSLSNCLLRDVPKLINEIPAHTYTENGIMGCFIMMQGKIYGGFSLRDAVANVVIGKAIDIDTDTHYHYFMQRLNHIDSLWSNVQPGTKHYTVRHTVIMNSLHNVQSITDPEYYNNYDNLIGDKSFDFTREVIKANMERMALDRSVVPDITTVPSIFVYNSKDVLNVAVGHRELSTIIERTAARRSEFNPLGGYYIVTDKYVYFGNTGLECATMFQSGVGCLIEESEDYQALDKYTHGLLSAHDLTNVRNFTISMA